VENAIRTKQESESDRNVRKKDGEKRKTPENWCCIVTEWCGNIIKELKIVTQSI
jgi:hypothetical protein